MTERESERGPKLQPSATDHDVWQALGQLTIYYAMLEGQLRFTIWTLSSPGLQGGGLLQEMQAAQILMAGRPFSTLVDMFCSLCKLRMVDPTRVAALRADLARVSEVRNRYMHSEWAVGNIPGTALRYRHTARAKDGLQFSYEHVTADDIRLLADDMGRVALRVAWVTAPHGDFAWPEERPS